MSAKLISIIGPPAVGKTTLAKLLTQELPGKLIREDYAGNPFLAESYAGDEHARLPGQLYFLLSRIGQLAEMKFPQSGLLVSDYGFCQDRIFATMRLSAEDLKLYDRVARRLETLVHAPNVLVHLDADEQTLLHRIRQRGRNFEHVMDKGFLGAMRSAYNEAAEKTKHPMIGVDCDATDFRDHSKLIEITGRIREKL